MSLLPDRDAELLLQGGQVAVKVWHRHHVPLVADAKVARTQAGVRAARCELGNLSIVFRNLAPQVLAQVTPIGSRKTRKLSVPLSQQCLEGMCWGVPVLPLVLRRPLVGISEGCAAAANKGLLPFGVAVVDWLWWPTKATGV